MITKIFLIIVIVLLMGAATYSYFVYSAIPAEPKLSGKIYRQNIQVGNLDRNYLSYIPRKLSSGPGIIFAMHGTGMNAISMRQWSGYELDKLADQYGFIVVYPNGYKGNWNDLRTNSPFEAKKENIDDVGFIESMVNRFGKEQHIDTQKVFIFGFSNGGQVAIRLALEKPKLVNAICAISANLPTPETFSFTGKGPASRVMLVTGTKDGINPYLGGPVTLFGMKKVGTAISAKATAEYFVERNAMNSSPENKIFPSQKADDPTSVELQRWTSTGKPAVELVTIVGGGHVIPQQKFRFPRLMGKTTGNFNAPLEAIRFFGLTESL